MKFIIMTAFALFTQTSFAALDLNCRIWSNSEKINLNVSTTLAFALGGKLKSMPLIGSTLTVIENHNTLLFKDNLSHLNQVTNEGVWEEINTTVYPIKKGEDIFNPKGEVQKSRRLIYNLVLKDTDYDGFSPELTELNLEVRPTFPKDSTYIGANQKNRLVLRGKEYTDLSVNCSVYISLKYFEALLDKN